MKNSLIIIGSIIVVALLGVIGALRYNVPTNNTSSQGKIQVAASFYPLYYFASQIGGDKAHVINITPAGTEPHDYDPSTLDIARINDSKLLLLNGTVESWGDKIRKNLEGTNVVIITAGEGLLTQQLTEDGQTQTDPHIWLDPIRAKAEAHHITQGFIKVDPKDAAYFQQNELTLNSKFDQLDQAYKTGLSSCKGKDIVTSHAAFGYLASRYHLQQVAIAGLSPDAEPSAQQLASVVSFAKTHAIQYIFFESLVSPKLSDTIAQEIGAKTLVLDPLEGVSDNDMKAGKNYFTIMQDNLKNLQIALACNT